ncbi:MAG: hypothetical protein R2827_08315 [Bdellovibrionales bacterium]
MRKLDKISVQQIPIQEGAILYGAHDVFYFKRNKSLSIETHLKLAETPFVPKKSKREADIEPGIVRLSWSF